MSIPLIITPMLIVCAGSSAKLAADALLGLWFALTGLPLPQSIKIIVFETNIGTTAFRYPTFRYPTIDNSQEPYQLIRLVMNESTSLQQLLDPESPEYNQSFASSVEERTLEDAQMLDGFRHFGAGHRRQYAISQFEQRFNELQIGSRLPNTYEQTRSPHVHQADIAFFEANGYEVSIESGIEPAIVFVSGTTGATSSINNHLSPLARTFAKSSLDCHLSIPDTRLLLNQDDRLLAANTIANLREISYFARPETCFTHTYPDGTVVKENRPLFDMIYICSTHTLSKPQTGHENVPDIEQVSIEIAKRLLLSILSRQFTQETLANSVPKISALLNR